MVLTGLKENKASMRILLTGKDGQLGWELHRRLEQKHDIIALGRDDLDLRDAP